MSDSESSTRNEYANWTDDHIPIPASHYPPDQAFVVSATARQPPRLVIGTGDTVGACQVNEEWIACDTEYTVPIEP